MTYLIELRESLVDAARRQHAPVEARSRGRSSRASDRWRQSMHHGRAILASVALGLAGPAVGAVQVGAPLGPEPKLSTALATPVVAPPAIAPRR